ncbi:MAG: hypothetical protein ACT4O1_01040 [Gemmatimonadota bacterium]
MTRRYFLLSPASTSGRRAALLFNPNASFELAVTLRTTGAPLGEVFSFLSGLYFRGKLAYARAFGASDDIKVITSDRGLVSPDSIITLDDLRIMADSPIDVSNSRYVQPLRDRAIALQASHAPMLPCSHAATLPCTVVLLGSIASGKYVDLLLQVFGEQLLFPQEFVGRGDMSRGGLMLRCADAGGELAYVPVAGALRHGKRPPKLSPR